MNASVSVAAAAIKQYVWTGGWIGASYPWYIPEVKRLKGNDEYLGAWRIANERAAREGWDLRHMMDSNFFVASEK